MKVCDDCPDPRMCGVADDCVGLDAILEEVLVGIMPATHCPVCRGRLVVADDKDVCVNRKCERWGR